MISASGQPFDAAQSVPPLGNFGTVLFDLDGTLYIDGDPLPGAAEFVGRCVDAGCLVGYVTNLSLHPKAHCLDALERMGLQPIPRQVLTAVEVLLSTLEGEVTGRRLAIIAADHVREHLELAGYRVVDLNREDPGDEVSAIVVGQVDHLTGDAAANADAALRAGVPVFASSTRGKMPTMLPGILSAGEVLSAVLHDHRPRVVDCGKPSSYFSAAIDELLQTADPVLVVGDSLESDIALARDNGWSGLLLGPPVEDGPLVPDYWAPDLAAAL